MQPRPPASHAPSTPTDHTMLLVKVVPGAKRDQISGMLGDRVKIRVAAPPEDGRANEAVCAVIARTLGIRERQVEIVSGRTHPEKTVRIEGMSGREVRTLLGLV